MKTEHHIYVNNAASGLPKSSTSLKAFNTFVSTTPKESRNGFIAGSDLDAARERIARVLKVQAHEVFFTSNASLAANLIIQGLLSAGDLCLYDNRNHNSITRLVHETAIMGEQIHLVSPEEQLDIIPALDLIEKKKPKLVCLTHVSNVTGSIYELDIFIEGIKSVSPSTLILLDSSQAAGLCKLDLIGKCDFVFFPAHKHLYSIEGAALFVCKRKIKNIIFGGTGVRSASLNTSDGKSHFTEVGTPNIPAIMSMASSLEESYAILSETTRHNCELLSHFLSEIQLVNGVKLIGRKSVRARVSIVSIDLPGLQHEQMSIPFLRSKNIIARGGLHCSPLLHEQLGILERGTLRFSFGRYNTLSEINTIIASVGELSWVAKHV